ncbi:RNA polymerase sigma-70 factor [Tamlana sp. 2201CG12-4]|uniref:RNA polymerase sigma factor n=1 Tax=Tamlana sp. 2201CG12-4 TaxID=3112582 RepID=UPI002DBB78B9|nr:RNA polymerase sigma-70 factor [Tamlana sp. 2201CG12-4]MEC3906675.1 RNA polymerase sigma-70 factor [Tamlana sp. 2201CG12-4]
MSDDYQILPSTNLRSVFKTYYKALTSYAHNYIDSSSECQDIVQEVFISIWEKKTTFSNEVSLKVYLYKSVRNKCYDSIKHKKVKETYAKRVLQELKDDNIFVKHVLEEEMTLKLYKAIETLPKRKKEIIKLSLGNLNNKDIADRLNIKLQTVKTLKSQAYKALRKLFNEKAPIINCLIFIAENIKF